MHTQPFIMYARIDFTHVLPKSDILISKRVMCHWTAVTRFIYFSSPRRI